jgi:hypothetical protein
MVSRSVSVIADVGTSGMFAQSYAPPFIVRETGVSVETM